MGLKAGLFVHPTRRMKMAPITVLNDPNASMWYYPESKIVHHQVHQFFFGPTFRDIMNKGIETLQKNGAHKWLADDRAVAAWAPEDMEWGNADWFPRAVKAGWKYWAIIMPEKAVGKMTVKKLADSYSARGVQTKVFSTPEDGIKWLESCL
jgi:hypothetical protein